MSTHAAVHIHGGTHLKNHQRGDFLKRFKKNLALETLAAFSILTFVIRMIIVTLIGALMFFVGYIKGFWPPKVPVPPSLYATPLMKLGVFEVVLVAVLIFVFQV